MPSQKLLSRSLLKTKYEEKILEVTRVTKVVKGGKILSFRAIVVLGDKRGKVAIGIGKGDNVVLALEKAILYAKKHTLRVPLTTSLSIPHSAKAKYGAAKVFLQPRAIGTGVVAGGSVRPVLELAGIQNVSAKQFGSNNLLNNAKATILALSLIKQKVDVGQFQSLKNQVFYKLIMKKEQERKNRKIREKLKKLRELSREISQKNMKNFSVSKTKKKEKYVSTKQTKV
jgi:small subunit ribosomal protein S5